MKRNTKSGLKKNFSAVPVSKIATIRRSAPVGSMDNGSFRVRYSEFVAPLSERVTDYGWHLLPPSDATPGLDINAGSAVMFPWLSEQARHWEKYKFLRLEFDLLPKQPTTSRGLVAMAFDYDYSDAVATSKADMLQNMSIVEGSTYNPLHLAVDCSRLSQTVPYYFVSNANGETVGDPRFANAGFLMVSLDSVTTEETYGFDLWVTYEVVLNIPRAANELVDSGLSSPTIMQAPEYASTYTFRSGLEDLSTQVGNLFRVVHSGAGTIPVLRDAESVDVGVALDVSRLGGVLLKDTNISPIGGSFMGYAIADYINLWDRTGALLASLWAHSGGTGNLGGAFAAQGGVWGDVNNAATGLAGDQIHRAHTTIPLDGLRKLYPNLCYLCARPRGTAYNTIFGTATSAAITTVLFLLSGDKHSRGLK